MKVLLAGDSTVANCPTHEYPMSGWGAHLAPKVYSWAAVHNFAQGGASTESFREEGLWAALLEETAEGDLVLIQFGHNDQKRPHLAARTGYAANLRSMVAEARGVGARPVLCTSVERRHFLTGRVPMLEDSLEDYPEVVRELAVELKTPLIDLNNWTRELYVRLGVEGSKALFCHFEPGEHAHWPDGLRDDTHFHVDAARLIADHVAFQLQLEGFDRGDSADEDGAPDSADEDGADEGLLYMNPLAQPEDVEQWIAEGPLQVVSNGSVAKSALEFSGSLDDETHGDHAHWTFWCPVKFPDGIRITWEFLPLQEPGLAMVFFAAAGHGGRDLFSSVLAQRTGFYPQYHSGEMDALHLSYFRHKHADERAFRTCNLRKSAGFELVAQAADPLPPAEDALNFYRMELTKDGPDVAFSINSLPVLSWRDESSKVLEGGYLGFRQMAPLRASYRNLLVEKL